MSFLHGIFLCLIVLVHSLPQKEVLENNSSTIFTKHKQSKQLNVESNESTLQTQIQVCTLKNGQSGECVQYYLCNDNTTIITDGVGIFDRFAEECPNIDEMCCGIPDDTSTSMNFITSHSEQDQTHYSVKGCGQRNPSGIGYRFDSNNYTETAFGEFPWMVAVLKEDTELLNDYVCGGSLIHPKVAMTAAHCVIPEEGAKTPKFIVRAGEWDLQNINEILPHQNRKVVKIISHPKYHSGALFNNIALLILDSPISWAENIGVVCLPPASSTPPATTCYASGWGKDALEKEGKQQIILKWVDLPIVEHNKCQLDLRKTRLGHRFILNPSFVCAGGEKGKGTCEGQAGSPLVCPISEHPNKYVQSGIVSWRVGCGEVNVPGVYTHVAHLRDWIDQQLLNNDIDMTPYHSGV